MFTTNTERRGPSFLDCWCNSCGWPSSILLLSPTTRLLPELCSQHSFSLLQSSYPHNKNLSINSKTTLGQQSFQFFNAKLFVGRWMNDVRCHAGCWIRFFLHHFLRSDRSQIVDPSFDSEKIWNHPLLVSVNQRQPPKVGSTFYQRNFTTEGKKILEKVT